MSKNSTSFCYMIFLKIRFLGSRVGAEKSQKIREIVSFWEVAESSAGPNFTILLTILRIFSSSKSLKSVLSIRSSQKKSLRLLRAASTKFFVFFTKVQLWVQKFLGTVVPKKSFFRKGHGLVFKTSRIVSGSASADLVILMMQKKSLFRVFWVKFL